MRATTRKLFINHPAVDYVAAVFGAVAYLVARELIGGSFQQVPAAQRAVMLQTLSGVSVAILGVAVTAVAIVSALAPKPRVAAFVESVSGRLRDIILGSLISLFFIAVGFALLIAVDDYGRAWPWALGTALIALLAARSARLVWILTMLFVAATREDGRVDLQETQRAEEEARVKAKFEAEQYTLESAQQRGPS